MGFPAAPTLKLYFTPLHFILQSPDTGVSAQLILERNTGRCYCTENFNPFENGANEGELYKLDIFLIIGIFVIDDILYLGVVTDADIIGNIHNANIYEVKSIELLPYIPNIKKPETQSIDNISKLFTAGFYFSYYYDLTRSLQETKPNDNIHSRADQSFYWNLGLYSDLINQGVDTQWLIPIIQGFVSIEETECQNTKLVLALISRRSCKRTGTRYNCRGIDDDGNVANYVESEQILINGNYIFAYLQVRGSLPIYWEQTGITAQVNLNKSQDLSSLALKKHFNSLLEDFSHVTMINLLQDSKFYEKILTTEVETIIKLCKEEFKGKIVYQYYDFHENCRNNRYGAINELIKSLQAYSDYYKFYSENSSKIGQKQKGVMRTNCLDCLDRTNVVQSYISWSVLQEILETTGISLYNSLDQHSSSPLMKAFKNMWADNGDMLSFQYTGTSSTISSITRGEKPGLASLIKQSLKSIERFYNANLSDAAKQKSIDAVLRKPKDVSQINKIETEILARESEYTKYTSYALRLVTWNLGGCKLYQMALVQDLLGSGDYDILVFSLQEIVKLNPNNVLREGNNFNRVSKTKFMFDSLLGDYSLISECNLVGVFMLVYARNTLCGKISKIETDFLRLGFGGKMGNKGAVVVRFNIDDSTVCVVACHLESGQSKLEVRKSQLRDIQAEVFAKEQPRMQIFEHDFKFICGDLNFRVNLSNGVIRQLVEQKRLSEMISYDQLVSALAQGVLPGYKEAPIGFLPSYKFDKGTDFYDTSKKQRSPAWCDRILYNGDIEIVKYSSLNLRYSDHKPVFADAMIRCKKYNKARKQEITQVVLNEFGFDTDLEL